MIIDMEKLKVQCEFLDKSFIDIKVLLEACQIDLNNCDGCARFNVSEWCNTCFRGDKADNFLAKIKVKEINLNDLACSGIDMEFQGKDHGPDWWFIGKFVSNDTSKGYESNEGYWNKCRVRENNIHFLTGSWALPKGLSVILYFCDNRDTVPVVTGSFEWSQIQTKKNIIGFECLGAGDGYKYGWEK